MELFSSFGTRKDINKKVDQRWFISHQSKEKDTTANPNLIV